MLEADAKTKICPVMSWGGPGVEQHPHGHTRCVASACMMWQQSYAIDDDGFCGLAQGHPYGYPPGALAPAGA